MCGIAGILCRKPLELSSVVRRQHGLMAHRGSDDYAVLSFSNGHETLAGEAGPGPHDAVFSHWRLSILDTSSAGRQPMRSSCGRYQIVFNGEIYNYIELRRELSQLGHCFRSQTDTEVLLAAFIEWGVNCFSRLVGMFALAIVDTKEKLVTLARDHFGIKPLYYVNNEDCFAFASEIKALLVVPGFRPLLNDQSVFHFLRWGLTDWSEATIYAGVRHLPAGSYMRVAMSGLAVEPPQRFWNIRPSGNTRISFRDATARMRELFLESLRIHLRSDVPVSATLSGGLDSSGIVLGVGKVAPSFRLNTFSFVAEEARIDESAWVELVTRDANVTRHSVRAEHAEMEQECNDLVYSQDEPFDGMSIYAQRLVYRAIRKAGIKVALDGQGADEFLAGYFSYLGVHLAVLLESGAVSEAAGIFRRSIKRSGLTVMELLGLVGHAAFPQPLGAIARSLSGKGVTPNWLKRDWMRRAGVETEKPTSRAPNQSLVEKLADDVSRANLPKLLRYADRNAMCFSVENRVPFLDHRLVEFALSLPASYLVSGAGVTKHVFREAMRGIIPDRVIDRNDKIGFAAPEVTWLMAGKNWINSEIMPYADSSEEYMSSKCLLSDWARFSRGDKSNSRSLWRRILFILWRKIYKV